MAINFDKENVIEWFNGQSTICVTLSHPKYIRAVNRLHNKYPNEVVIRHVNSDGSILAHLPLKMLKLSFKNARIRTVSDKSE